jgi:hypothetical protein
VRDAHPTKSAVSGRVRPRTPFRLPTGRASGPLVTASSRCRRQRRGSCPSRSPG